MINGLILRQLSVVSILLLAVSSIHAGEWSGNVSRQASEVDTLCVELDKMNSPHLQKICLKKITVKWTLKTSEQSALIRSSIHWQLQPTLWLRTKGERPLSSFSKGIQSAYQATVPTDMTLAAFIYPEVNSAPSNTGSAFDNLGVALEIGAGNLKKSGKGFSFSTPSSPGWDTLLNDAPSHVPCIISKQKKSADYIPGEVSKELVRDGLSLSDLTICQLSFADLKQLNNAMKTTKSTMGSLTVDKGISLDDLLAGIDPVTSVDSNIELVSEETTKAGASLNDLLEGVEERIAQKRQQEAVAEAQASLQRQTAANDQACRQEADYFEKILATFLEKLAEPADNSNSRYGHWDTAGDCSPIARSINSATSYKAIEKGLYDCLNYREDLVEEAQEKINNVDFSGCSFEGGDPKDNFKAIVKLVKEENYYYDDQLTYVDNLRRGAALRQQAEHNGAIDRARMEAIWGESSGRGGVDSSQNLRDLSNNNNYQNYLAPKLKLKTVPVEDTASFSYPETTIDTGVAPRSSRNVENCYVFAPSSSEAKVCFDRLRANRGKQPSKTKTQ